MLQCLCEFVVQLVNDINIVFDCGLLMVEVKQLVVEVDCVVEIIMFNGMNILDGIFKGKQFQIGVDVGIIMQIDVDLVKVIDIGVYQMILEQVIILFDLEIVVILGYCGLENFIIVGIDLVKDIVVCINGIFLLIGVLVIVNIIVVLEGLSDGLDVVLIVQFDINGVLIKKVVILVVDLNGGQCLELLCDVINDLIVQIGVIVLINDGGNIVLEDLDGDDIVIINFILLIIGLIMIIILGDGVVIFDLDLIIVGILDIVIMKGQVNMILINIFLVVIDVIDVVGIVELFLNIDLDLYFGLLLSVVVEIDIIIVEGVNDVLKVIDVVLLKINDSCVDLGVVLNCFDLVVLNLINILILVQVVKLQVMDVDFVQELINLVCGQILSQVVIVMLVQVNLFKQGVLQLFCG